VDPTLWLLLFFSLLIVGIIGLPLGFLVDYYAYKRGYEDGIADERTRLLRVVFQDGKLMEEYDAQRRLEEAQDVSS